MSYEKEKMMLSVLKHRLKDLRVRNEAMQTALLESELSLSRLRINEMETRIKFYQSPWEKMRRGLIAAELILWPVLVAYVLRHW